MTGPELIELEPIGVVTSTLVDLAAAPRQGDEGAPDAWLVIEDRFAAGLQGLGVGARIVVVTWPGLARRDVLRTRPRNDPGRSQQGVFTTRSPDRPNPIGLHEVTVLAVDGPRVQVDQMEAVDGTPVLDVKPVLPRREDR
jgi:tRNA-Thr(GGU) m(6)t(6)A37 methyltransferase TsaA